MMIPLVFALSQKDGVLDEEILGKLLKIRNECREKSLRKNPTQRLVLEQKISKILFYYFSTLESEGKIKPNTKFDKIVKDLEFIDAKLVQLQQVYNIETEKWNRLVMHKAVWWFFYIFHFRKFKKFEMPKNDNF
ncbi:LemA family protein [Candidatus Gracilibacteria bacterium]|nr:LemA family protein [Candidatus Gracilibacteria bacterium]